MAGGIREDVYKIAIESSNNKIDDLEVKIANTKLELKGEIKNQNWVDWVKIFGQKLDSQKDWDDEKKKAYLTGLIEEIKVNYDEQKNEHELTIQFKLPIVNDIHEWKNRSNKKQGYIIKDGTHTSTLTVKKKSGDGRKPNPKLPPNEHTLLRWSSRTS